MIYVECRADYIFIKRITELSKRFIEHQSGKGNLCNKLKR